MYLTIDNTQRYSFLTTSTTLLKGLIVLLHRSWLHESSFFPCGIKNSQLLQYSHTYQISVYTNVKTMYARACVRTPRGMVWNGDILMIVQQNWMLNRNCVCTNRHQRASRSCVQKHLRKCIKTMIWSAIPAPSIANTYSYTITLGHVITIVATCM